MNPTLAKAIVALALAAVLSFFTARAFLRRRATGSVLELLGAVGVLILGLTHLLEGLHVASSLGWGRADSPGHYLNLASLTLAIAGLLAGYLLTKRARVAG
jgi:hypothetical protein